MGNSKYQQGTRQARPGKAGMIIYRLGKNAAGFNEKGIELKITLLSGLLGRRKAGGEDQLVCEGAPSVPESRSSGDDDETESFLGDHIDRTKRSD